jgi:hypothetical protein
MNRRTHVTLLLILASFMVWINSLAQNQPSDSTFLREGLWALQFGISSNFTLSSIQGTTFAVKYQLSDRNAIRAGVTLSGNISNGNSSATGAIADTGYGSVPGSSSGNSATITFVAEYLWYINPSGPIHFFVGLGPYISYYHYNNTSDNSYFYTSNNQGYWQRSMSSSNTNQWAFGPAGVAGVEWFTTRWFSLHAEYNDGVQYQWNSQSSKSDNTATILGYIPVHRENSSTSKGWNVSSSSVSFGLNVYW